MQQELIHHLLLKKTDFACLKPNVDKLHIDKLKNVPTNLSNLKSRVDKLDVDKLVPVPVDLSKLSDVIKNDVVEKDVYNAKIKNIEDKIGDITNLATKTTLNAKINELKGEICSITNLATTAALNAKINEVKGEISNTTNFVTTSALTAVENKISSVSNLVKKADYNTKFNEIENKISDHNRDKYITTPECNTFTAEIFDLRLKRANLASKSAIANFVKRTDFDNKLKDVTSNKNELNILSKKVKAISTKGLTKDLINKFIFLNGTKYFSSGIFQNYLVFIPAIKYIKYFHATTQIYSWKSNGISEESIEHITKSDNNSAPTFIDHHVLLDINFNRYCLIKNISIPKKVINLYISYRLGHQLKNLNKDFTLDN